MSNITNHQIYKDVMAALQNAEEMGGVRDDAEYIELLAAISAECANRAENCKASMSVGD